MNLNDYVERKRIKNTSDGFFAADISIADILSKSGIDFLLGKDGSEIKTSYFYDDWYVFAIEKQNRFTYGLFKMREQECDKEYGADGDIPGVTVSFVEFHIDKLINCVDDPTDKNRVELSEEIERVVSKKGEKHSATMKEYFIKAESEASYLIAEMYVSFIAGFCNEGYIKVPESFENKKNKRRLSDFIKINNKQAGKTICDGEKIYINNPEDLSDFEKYAILATHTANTSFNSFAAEIQFHAEYLMDIMKIEIPFLSRSVYDSAIRADMSVMGSKFEGFCPYYDDNNKIVRKQAELHGIK